MKRKYVYLYLLGLLLFSVACTGNFRDYNTDLSGITDDDLIIDDNGYGIRLGIIQQGIYFNYDYGTDISVGECYPKYTSCSVRDNENIKGGSDASCDGLLWSYHL